MCKIFNRFVSEQQNEAAQLLRQIRSIDAEIPENRTNQLVAVDSAVKVAVSMLLLTAIFL